MPNLGNYRQKDERTIMKCTLCGTEIRGSYLFDTWQQAICACHKVEHCSSCGRFVKPTDLHLPDGRCLCSVCKPSVVSLPQHIEWVCKRVRSILASHGINDLPTDIPTKLVSPAEMAKLNGSGQINLYQPGLAQTSKTIGLFGSHCKHTIYIFDFLPKIQFAGVLAHEMLHVWQNEKGISLPPIYTEGFCNLGSYVVYTAINTELSRHFVKRLEEDPHPVYGDGFRKVLEIYRRNNKLNQIINHIK